MGPLEKTITAIIVVMFVFLLLFIEFEDNVQVYDCMQLDQHNSIPNEVIEECFKLLRPTRSISIST